MEIIASLVIIAVGFVALVLLGLELQYRRRAGNRLELQSLNWRLATQEADRYLLVGELAFRNLTQRLEIMVPEMQVDVKLLSSGSLDHPPPSWLTSPEAWEGNATSSLNGIQVATRVIPRFKGASTRLDGYWEGHIVKVGKTDPLEVWIEIRGQNLSALTVAWIQIHYMTYGPAGRIPRVHHMVVPLKFPAVEDSKNWRSTSSAEVLPIRTHLLTPIDNPVEVVKRYVLPHAKPGDVVTIGESPVAIMQGRFHHPSSVRPGWVARRLCYLFLPTSSLATACGLQTLIDIVGPGRVLFAFIVGAIAKVFGKPGVFYQLAGEQARLIDDVTGTIPPYDQFIVLGPERSQQLVDHIKQETGLSAAIVDVNDLRAVKVLAATADLQTDFLKQALISNPAGNANEQTPIVLIRPTPAR